jgi:Gram-negative bacterial TonB protein C-terminal
MPARALLIALLFLTVSPQTQPRLPIHVESLVYPSLARFARIQGDAILVAHIGSDGSVSIPVLKSGHPLLIHVAEDNLKKWKFQTGEEQEMEITYHFKLKEPASYSPITDCQFDLPNSVTVTSDIPDVDTMQ